MSNDSNRDSSRPAAVYRLKLSTVAVIVFLAVAAVCFYLQSTGVINDIVYYGVLLGLIVAALVLTYVFGKISKKRYTSTSTV